MIRHSTEVHLGCIRCHHVDSPLDNPMQSLHCGHFVHAQCLATKIRAATHDSFWQTLGRITHLAERDPMRCNRCHELICRRKIRLSPYHADAGRTSIARQLRERQQTIEASIIQGQSVAPDSARLRFDLTGITFPEGSSEETVCNIYKTLFAGVIDKKTIAAISPCIRSIEFVRPTFTHLDEYDFNLAESTCFIELIKRLHLFTALERISIDLTESSRFPFLESFHSLHPIETIPDNLQIISLRFRDPIPDFEHTTRRYHFAWNIGALIQDTSHRAQAENKSVQLKLINAQSGEEFTEEAFNPPEPPLPIDEKTALRITLATYALLTYGPPLLTLSILTLAAFKFGLWMTYSKQTSEEG